ncbi:MAG TPA: TolC family protein [Tepidisphaeraceae bacterium]|jgi:outer membrane protein TolC|nr:TolC family protein [Tepidisphaeraceae bacterium]
MQTPLFNWRWLIPLPATLFLSGCVFAPRAAKIEQDRVTQAGRAYAASRSARVVANLPVGQTEITWREVLGRALLASGELEAAYYEWAMAVTQIDQKGTWPQQPLELGFDYMFSAERMKTLDRMTFSAGLMDATGLPNKAYQDAKVAWRDAEAAGERFRQAKFELQRKVLSAWADYALQAEKVRVQEENVRLLRLVSETAGARVRAGAPQQDLLRAQVELKQAENELSTMRSEVQRQRATLNALLVRPAESPLPPPVRLPEPRPLIADDSALLAMGVRNNPELAALDKDQLAREAAIVRARLDYQPEINLTAAFTGSISQTVGGMLVVPTRLPAIRAMVREARSDLRRVEAMADQARSDRGAQFAATLVALRDAERRTRVFEAEIVPLATRTLDLTRRAYASGSATYLDVIESQRTLLDVRLMVADARAMRERMLAELEMLAGADVETLAEAVKPATQPTSPMTMRTNAVKTVMEAQP